MQQQHRNLHPLDEWNWMTEIYYPPKVSDKMLNQWIYDSLQEECE